MVNLLDSHEEIVNQLTAHVLSKMPPKEGALIESFVRQYYMGASAEDLSSRSIHDLYGSVISHWQYLQNRKKGEAKVRVYNPQFEENGWQSTHTVIEIAHDDVPFLVESVRMELDRRNLTVHLILYCGGLKLRRNKEGNVIEVVGNGAKGDDIVVEAPLYLEIDRQSDPKVIKEIEEGIVSVLQDVHLAVSDWCSMKEKMNQVIEELKTHHGKASKDEVKETDAFLNWINDNKFTFLSYYQIDLISGKNGPESKVVESSRLGVCKRHKAFDARSLYDLPQEARNLALSPKIITLNKTSSLSTVHRQVYTDFISIKIFNKEGAPIGEHRFIGLYTAEAYNEVPENIPLLRQKVNNVLTRACLTRDLHEGKVLLNIIGNLPRDDLFQAQEEELYTLATGVMQIQERKKIRLFVRKDIFERFYSCLVYVPRDRFTSDLRAKFQDLLMRIFGGTKSQFTTVFSDSVLARIHYVIWVPEGTMGEIDRIGIEDKLKEAALTWEDGLHKEIIEHFGEEKGNAYFNRFKNSFPAGYRATFSPMNAVYDVKHILELNENNRLGMSFYNPLEASEGTLRFKLFQPDNALPLSDIIPMLECLGLRVISESPHEIIANDNKVVWINDFCLVHAGGLVINAHDTKGIFQDAFFNIWNKRSESDGFNRLVLSALLNWREITMLRAYAKYMWQTGFTFSQSYVENTFTNNIELAKKIGQLFKLRFDPSIAQSEKKSKVNALKAEIEVALESVVNLDEDRILRRYVAMILGTLRTNFFQKNKDGEYNDYIAFKFDPNQIPELPLPRPMFEIFVYSPRVEGVHLRGAKVARGGLRWSDRREDFRTEVLGLMKAQQVKNSVIVPLGAKGGFYPKNLPQHGTREEYMKEAISCYQIFISALLDVTDNIVDNKVVPPVDVVRYDEDDPYLVVAADKGTATFSDIANELAVNHGFWLGDAFASGGSRGYDHKKMGITAKGAWESVKGHFKEFGIDTQTQDFTVIGIGDMAGDVFGNGMLLSEHICLVGAFNHMHIFLDPTPDPKLSFEERTRLFNLPRSSWQDYNEKLISKGGGIHLRSAKSIKLTPEVQKLLGTDKEAMVPNELIKAMLCAQVDLLWNGGIGTYVKATHELNVDVGDRTNDALRVNGADLRCKVVAEGGNLGFTQLGRIEYALKKGKINTDAIDNSAGVDCSDHEVNIKILLNAVVSNGDMTQKQRNQLLVEMTDEVAELVLSHNKAQNEALGYLEAFASTDVQMLGRLIQEMEKAGDINRQLEFLPDNDTLASRKLLGQGLTRPEMAILVAYMKNILKRDLLASDLPEDPYFQQYLSFGFPKVLTLKYRSAMEKHRLKREIISTQVGNLAVNEMGMNFVLRLKEETGATQTQIISAFMVSREIFDVQKLRRQIRELDIVVAPIVQAKMQREVNRLVRRGARWFLRHRRTGLDIQKSITEFGPRVAQISDLLPKMLTGAASKAFDALSKELIEANVPKLLADKIASMSGMFSALDIVEAAINHKEFDLGKVLKVYFAIGMKLQLGWFREQIKDHQVANHWDSLARAAIRDDLDRQQKSLTISILKLNADVDDIEKNLEVWMQRNQLMIDRWKYMVSDLRASAQKEFTMFQVALRELLDLAQSSQNDRLSS